LIDAAGVAVSVGFPLVGGAVGIATFLRRLRASSPMIVVDLDRQAVGRAA
jgi:hypothetical protein